MKEQERWMKRCLQLGREALLNGNAPVGSVLVAAGDIIGKGREAGKSKNDITCHAEIEAIRDAIHQGYSDLWGATLYTTHEPCIMCAYVIRQHRIPTVVMGLTVAEVGGYTSAYPILRATNIPHWGPAPQVVMSILAKECAALDREFRNRI